MPIYENGPVQIHYEEAGSGFPLLIIPGGGLNATIAGLANHAFNPLEEFSDIYRVVALDLRNANGGQSNYGDSPLNKQGRWIELSSTHGPRPVRRACRRGRHHDHRGPRKHPAGREGRA